MKQILFSLCFIFLCSCNGKENNNKTNPSQVSKPIYREVEKTKDFSSRTLQSYIKSKKEYSGIELNQDIEDLISVRNISLFQESNSSKLYLVLKLSQQIDINLKQTHRLIIRTFPYNIDDLRDDTVSLGRDYDTWYSNISTISDGENDYLYAEIGSLGDFKKVQVQLLEKSTKKFLKESIIVNNLNL